MSYNPLDDVPLSLRSGAKPRPSAEGVAPSSAMDFPSQFSDAEGDSDEFGLGSTALTSARAGSKATLQ